MPLSASIYSSMKWGYSEYFLDGGGRIQYGKIGIFKHSISVE